MTYNIVEIIFIVLAILAMAVFAVVTHRAKKKYRDNLINEFEDEKEVDIDGKSA